MLRRLWILGLWYGLALTTGLAQAGDCSTITPVAQAQRQVWLDGRLLAQGPVSLPDPLPRDWRREGFVARYTLDVSACTHQPGQSLWLFRVGAPYILMIDGAAAVPELPRAAAPRSPRSTGARPCCLRCPRALAS